MFSSPTKDDAEILVGLVSRIGTYEALNLYQAICADRAERLRDSSPSNSGINCWDKLGRELCACDQLANEVDAFKEASGHG